MSAFCRTCTAIHVANLPHRPETRVLQSDGPHRQRAGRVGKLCGARPIQRQKYSPVFIHKHLQRYRCPIETPLLKLWGGRPALP
jgi:hypothetical protein